MVANPLYARIPHPATGRLGSFRQFYNFYLGEHANRTCRRLHLLGTSGALVLLAAAAATRQPRLALAAPLCGYSCAWVGHFFYEHNKPATFRYPLWSLRSDFLMWWEVASGQRAW